MKATNSLASDKLLDGHIYIAVPLLQGRTMCNLTQLSVPKPNNNNATTDEVTISHGLSTCLRAYGIGVIFALSSIGSMIGLSLRELLGGLSRYHTYAMKFACFPVIIIFCSVVTKQCYPITFQNITETTLGMRWFVFGSISTEVFVQIYLQYYDMSNFGWKFYLSCVLQGLHTWYFTREHVENVGDAETKEGMKTLVSQIV